MAKQQTNKVFMPEQLEKVGEADKDILFWDFKKVKFGFFYFLGKEKLDYEVFKVKEAMSGDIYYLPAHTKLKSSFDEKKDTVIYKITHIQESKGAKMADGEYKTYNSYEIEYYKKP